MGNSTAPYMYSRTAVRGVTPCRLLRVRGLARRQGGKKQTRCKRQLRRDAACVATGRSRRAVGRCARAVGRCAGLQAAGLWTADAARLRPATCAGLQLASVFSLLHHTACACTARPVADPRAFPWARRWSLGLSGSPGLDAGALRAAEQEQQRAEHHDAGPVPAALCGSVERSDDGGRAADSCVGVVNCTV